MYIGGSVRSQRHRNCNEEPPFWTLATGKRIGGDGSCAQATKNRNIVGQVRSLKDRVGEVLALCVVLPSLN